MGYENNLFADTKHEQSPQTFNRLPSTMRLQAIKYSILRKGYSLTESLNFIFQPFYVNLITNLLYLRPIEKLPPEKKISRAKSLRVYFIYNF